MTGFLEKMGISALKCDHLFKFRPIVLEYILWGELVERRDTVVLSGDLRTMEKRMNTRNTLEEKWESGIENLDVDLSEVTAMDFDSLTELLKIRNRFLQAGTKVELKNIPLRIRRIMQIFRVPISGG